MNTKQKIMSNKKLILLTTVMLLMPTIGTYAEDTTSTGGDPPYTRGLTMITPAEQWREGLPSGNGTVGALVYGGVSKERVVFNHNELWYGGRVTDIPDMSAELPVVRKLLLEGEYWRANDHYRNKMREKGFKGANGTYHPAFDLNLNMGVKHLFEDYSRTVDFETGEVNVSWTDGTTAFSRRLFVSIPDGISVMSIKGNEKQSVTGDVTLDIHDLKDALLRNAEPFDPGFTYKTSAEGEFVEFRANGSSGGEFGGLVRVVIRGGEMLPGSSEVDGGSQRGKEGTSAVRYAGADEVTLLIAVYANEKATTAIPRLKEKLSSIDDGYDVLFDRHKVLHSKKFNSMGVNLNTTGKRDTPNELLLLDAYQNPPSTELMEKLFDYGRYLLISSSTAGGYPTNLQGIWNGDYRPPWGSLLGNNENLQISYWQALPGNLEESMMAFYDYFDSHLDDFRYNAKQLYGCRGIYIPPFMSPDSGIMRHTAPHVVYWSDAAGWLASFYYDYYLFTGDRQFLKHRAVPFIKEVALFYEDFIVKDDQGTNMFLPSQSPENQPAEMPMPGAEQGMRRGTKVQINSTISIAIAKEVFTNLIRSCELLDIEQEGVQRWKKILADMPAYQINEDGAIKEWLHPDFKDNYEHRHISHIYPLFPGYEITHEKSPELYAACRTAIEKRLIGLSSQTGWSLAHLANIWGRLGDGDKALDTIGILTRCCLGKNLFTYHNDWRGMGVTVDLTYGRSAPFQMDANFGITAAVTEMLCSSDPDILRLLPGLPSKWSTGDFHGILTRTGAKVSAQWDMDQKEVKLILVAVRDTVFDLKFPRSVSTQKISQPAAVSESQYGSQYRQVSLKKGDELTLQIKLE